MFQKRLVIIIDFLIGQNYKNFNLWSRSRLDRPFLPGAGVVGTEVGSRPRTSGARAAQTSSSSATLPFMLCFGSGSFLPDSVPVLLVRI